MRLDDIHIAEKYMIGGVKTAAGRNRTIPIADCILPFVRHFYNIARFKGISTLLISGNGKAMQSAHPLRVAVKSAFTQYNLPQHLPHDFRHTFVSLAAHCHIPDYQIRRIVGHASRDNVTDAVYTHIGINELLCAVNALPWGDSPALKDFRPVSHLLATATKLDELG